MTQWLRPWRMYTARCAQRSSLRHPGNGSGGEGGRGWMMEYSTNHRSEDDRLLHSSTTYQPYSIPPLPTYHTTPPLHHSATPPLPHSPLPTPPLHHLTTYSMHSLRSQNYIMLRCSLVSALIMLLSQYQRWGLPPLHQPEQSEQRRAKNTWLSGQ